MMVMSTEHVICLEEKNDPNLQTSLTPLPPRGSPYYATGNESIQISTINADLGTTKLRPEDAQTHYMHSLTRIAEPVPMRNSEKKNKEEEDQKF